MTTADLRDRARRADYGVVSTALSRCSDRELRELVEAAVPVGAGIGGQTLRMEVDGVPVFVKQVRLTDLERQPENVGSTANLFGLPMSCHLGVGSIGSSGFGAWRELAVHALTTVWVLAGDHDSFPLTYHWRVLTDSGRPLPDELADVDRAVAYWGGGGAVRRRIEALRESTASLTLFLEYLPQTLHDWFGQQVAAGGADAEQACAMVERELEAGVAFLGSHGLLHLDAHFENILTDGDRLYFADYGLAVSSGFDLAPDEVGFVDRFRGYDRAYAATCLVNWLVVELFGYGPDRRRAFVDDCAAGELPYGVPPGVAAVLRRHAAVAAETGSFFRRFRHESRATPYPAEAKCDSFDDDLSSGADADRPVAAVERYTPRYDDDHDQGAGRGA
ncbi:protein kinase family protein [Isoptericola aurantiacus]|uniref:protein kinase family protein n=1 Tax=Isoptericola aurantiacus TaxID=3377839 RepID=UPI00383B6D47